MLCVFIYLILVLLFYFVSVFMVSWGGDTPWYLSFFLFLQDKPFDLVRANGEIKMSLIFINALFWTLCIAGLLFFALWFMNKIR